MENIRCSGMWPCIVRWVSVVIWKDRCAFIFRVQQWGAWPLGWESIPILRNCRKYLKHAMHSQLNRAILLCDVICDGKKLSKLRSFDRQYRRPQNCHSSRLSHIQLRGSLRESHTSVYVPTPRWHHRKVHPFLAIHSADEHRIIYTFSNTTS